MRKLILALLPVAVAGCVSVKMGSEELYSEKERKVSTEYSAENVSGVDTKIEKRTDGSTSIQIVLFGKFTQKEVYERRNPSVKQKYIAAGFFPGVMSCSGEYSDSFKNAAAISLYNLAFAGLPTVYGLLVEPFIPYYPSQTSSVVGKSAFPKSAFIGFSRYSKNVDANGVSHRCREISLERFQLGSGTVLIAPELGLTSGNDGKLVIPAANMPEDGNVVLKIVLDEKHPFKKAMVWFEDTELSVKCR